MTTTKFDCADYIQTDDDKRTYVKLVVELETENERLREALREIIELRPEDMPHAVENSMAAAIARDALNKSAMASQEQ